MKKLLRAASLFLALCLLLTAYAGAAAAKTQYSLDGGNVTLSLPSSWEAETELSEGTLLSVTRLDGAYTFTVIKQKVYHLIDPVTPPVVAYGTGTSANAVGDRTVADSQAASGTRTINGAAFSTYFTEDATSAQRSYWTSLADLEYRFTFTRTGAAFSEAEIQEMEGIMETVQILQINGLLRPATPSVQSFRDLQGHWAEDYANRAVELGLFNGLSETAFGPDVPMSRAMLVTVLYRMAGKPAAGKAIFSDVPSGAYYADAVAWASANDIVQGSNGRFRPDDALTRQELAAILYRYSGSAAAEAPGTALAGFPDAGSVAQWALSPMRWAVSRGLINGVSGKLLPAGETTRAQVAAILVRYLDGQ